MTNALPPRRPRPGPGHRPVAGPSTTAARPDQSSAPAPAADLAAPDLAAPQLPAASLARRGVVLVGDEAIRVPGFAALFHRHPQLTQRGGIAAVATGVLLFLVAGVTTATAGANAPHAHRS